jgi:hypothetical protein
MISGLWRRGSPDDDFLGITIIQVGRSDIVQTEYELAALCWQVNAHYRNVFFQGLLWDNQSCLLLRHWPADLKFIEASACAGVGPSLL